VLTRPKKVSASKQSITVTWTLTSDGGSPVLGYLLYRLDKDFGGTQLIYDGSQRPSISSFKDENVVTGRKYTYIVQAINRIGNSANSPESLIFIPSEKPGKSFAPLFVTSTSSTISLAFEPILDDGGLPITKYELHRDEGNNDFSNDIKYDLTTLYFILDIVNDPSLVLGDIYSFYLIAFNDNGPGIMSDISKMGLGSLPSAPNAPSIDRDQSSPTSMMITWGALTL